MVWLIGHRQPKGAVTAMLRPTVTAPHLDSTDYGCLTLDTDRRLCLAQQTFRFGRPLPGSSGVAPDIALKN
jgi:hypothetical protein